MRDPNARRRAASWIVAGALFGGIGVALSALAAHGARLAPLDPAARILLAHAPALLGLAALRALDVGGPLLRPGGVLLALGPGLFSADIAARVFVGDRLFPMAAPIGGGSAIVGWALILVGASIALATGGRRDEGA